MAGSDNQDIEMLRAIAHARMYVTSGRGLESVVHQLVHNDLGRISGLLTPALQRMDIGEPADHAVSGILDKEPDPHFRSFLAALIASGKPAVTRLDELSEALHSEREAKAEVYGSRLNGIVSMTAVLFVFSFTPTILRIFEKVPDNPIVPQLTLPYIFEWIFYGFCSIALTILMFLARVK